MMDYDGNSEGAEVQKKVIKIVDNYLLSLQKPKEFRSSKENNYLNQKDLAFEEVVALMEEMGVRSPKKLSVFEFQQRIEHYRKKKKPYKKD